MKPGDRGDGVRKLQQALRDAADPLPRYGVDGDFGGETIEALREFCSREGLTWEGGPVPGPVLVELGLAKPAPASVPASAGVRVFDLRAEASDPHPKSRKSASGKTVRRPPHQIDSIVLHQTAVKFARPSSDPSDLGLARRALRVACHGMAFDGIFALAAPLDMHIYHGDGFNGRSLGLEVDGNYPGLIGGRSTNKHPLTPVTEGTILAAREGMRLLVERALEIGAVIRYVYAHRQGDSWRRADPGEELWRKVVLEYAVPVLKLRTRPALSIPDPQGDPSRHGMPIPKRWDPDGVGDY